MFRFTLALVVSLVLTVAVRAADLPTGTWTANVDGTTGDLVITEVKDAKVTGSLLGTDFNGIWNGKTLTFFAAGVNHEAHLVSEPGEKGKIKYTLTGTREDRVRVPTRAQIHKVKVGWYAQLTADEPVVIGEIKAEIRGVLVYDGSSTAAYISVKRTGEDEVRVWLWASERNLAFIKKQFSALNGKEVTAAGKLSVFPKDTKDAIPTGAIYLPAPFELKHANMPK